MFRVFQSSTKCALIPERQPQRKPFFSSKKTVKTGTFSRGNVYAQCMQCFLFEVEATFIQTCIVGGRDAGCRSLQIAFYQTNQTTRDPVIPATKSQEDNFGPKSKCDTSCATTFQYHVALWYCTDAKVKPFNQSQVQIDKVFKLSSWILRILRCKQQKTILKERMRWGSPVAALGFDGNAESWVIRWMCVCVYECNITPIVRYQTC